MSSIFESLQLFPLLHFTIDFVYETFVITCGFICERAILKLNINILFESRGIYEEFMWIFHF